MVRVFPHLHLALQVAAGLVLGRRDRLRGLTEAELVEIDRLAKEWLEGGSYWWEVVFPDGRSCGHKHSSLPLAILCRARHAARGTLRRHPIPHRK